MNVWVKYPKSSYYYINICTVLLPIKHGERIKLDGTCVLLCGLYKQIGLMLSAHLLNVYTEMDEHNKTSYLCETCDEG